MTAGAPLTTERDRQDSEQLSELFYERDEGVTRRIAELIDRARRHDRPVGICGQAPSDHPDFAAFLMQLGIDPMSLNSDSVVEIIERVAEVEAG